MTFSEAIMHQVNAYKEIRGKSPATLILSGESHSILTDEMLCKGSKLTSFYGMKVVVIEWCFGGDCPDWALGD